MSSFQDPNNLLPIEKLNPSNLPIVKPGTNFKVPLDSFRDLSPAAESQFLHQFNQALQLRPSSSNEILPRHAKDESFINNAINPAKELAKSPSNELSYAYAIESSAQHKQAAPLEPSCTAVASCSPEDDQTEDQIPRKSGTREKLAIASPETQRKCQMANVFFLDYYFDLLTYLHQRKLRTAAFKKDMQEQNIDENEKESAWKYYCGKERAFLRKRRRRTNFGQFQILKQVGQGGYGQVFLARKRDTNEICALKKLNKKLLMRMNEVQHVLTERDILTFTQSEWLVRLLYAFQDPEYAFLAMEFVPGGDMRTLLNNSGVLREEPARFYIAEMITSVDALHQLGYLHRDLKPENFLIDGHGHIKLTDFGLSKGALSSRVLASLRGKLERAAKTKPALNRAFSGKRTWHRHGATGSISGLSNIAQQQLAALGNNPSAHTQANASSNINQQPKMLAHSVPFPSSLGQSQEDKVPKTWAFSLVGSPDYMAPEILSNKGYDLVADYWSLGCILFEFLAGYPPFTAQNIDDIWVNIYHWEEVLERPVYTGADADFNLSDEAWDLITKLITHRETRLCKISEIQTHSFFKREPTPISDFSKLRKPVSEGGIAPPFIPKLTSEVDTSYFDDFSDPENLKAYREIQERQALLESEYTRDEASKDTAGINSKSEQRGLRRNFIGFTFKHRDQRQYYQDALY